MTGSLLSEAGVNESVLQWLDGLGWVTYGLDEGHTATILGERYNRQRSEVIYWDLLAEAVVEINDELNSQMRDQLGNLSFERWTEAESIPDLENTIAAGRSELVVTTIQNLQDIDPGVQSTDEAVGKLLDDRPDSGRLDGRHNPTPRVGVAGGDQAPTPNEPSFKCSDVNQKCSAEGEI